MLRRHLRAVLAAALLTPVLLIPVVAEARAPALTCPAASQTGQWQRLPVEEFRGVPGVSTRGSVTGYALDAARPQRLLVTNGNTIKLSDSHGCAWDDVLVLEAQGSDRVPLSGVTSTIAALAHLPSGRSLAAVREGTGAASRPHVVSSDSGARDTWAESSTGLPTQGSPRLLEPAGDGRTAYLSLSPATDSGGSGGTLPGLPVGSDQAGPAGLLYATTDAGRTWQLRTTAGALPSGVTGFDALAVDPADPDLLYALSGGRLVVSRDGGRTLVVHDEVTGATALEPMEAGEVAVLVGSGQLLHSKDSGVTFNGHVAPAQSGSAAYRKGDGRLVVEAQGLLYAVDARGRGGSRLVDARVPATQGSARGDRAEQGSFHALAGNSLLRYVDPAPMTEVDSPRATGDLTVPPPPPGRMAPPSRQLRMPVGSSQSVDFSLVLPRSPTPLDLYLVIDTSEDMGNYIENLKRNLTAFTSSVEGTGIDLKVGVGTVGAGPRRGEAPYPDVYPGQPDYRKPHLYRRIRPIGEVGPDLTAAINSIRVEPPPPGRRGDAPEGQLLGLDELVDGDGVEAELSSAAAPSYVVPPGQQAGFRQAPGVRRVVALATEERFSDPYGTPMKPDGSLDKEGVAAKLKRAGIRHVGVAACENCPSKADLQLMSRLTDTFAPPGGIDCGDEIFIPAGAPLVCDSSRNFGQVLTRLVLGLADRQSVTLTPRQASPLVSEIDAANLRDLDVTVRNEIPFRVRVSCTDVGAGSYTSELDAKLRGTTVATARIAVTCTPLAAAAVPPPRPQAPQVQEPAPPAGQPAAQAPAPPAPVPPVVQPQAQPQAQIQVQTQVQPMTAAALQQQEQLQLAIALQPDEAERSELAMVDRRRSEELRALALLTVSMSAASVLGLARLRSRREQVVRVRHRS